MQETDVSLAAQESSDSRLQYRRQREERGSPLVLEVEERARVLYENLRLAHLDSVTGIVIENRGTGGVGWEQQHELEHRRGTVGKGDRRRAPSLFLLLSLQHRAPAQLLAADLRLQRAALTGATDLDVA